ncbi:TetR/AcrR family transcriptional regulator [Ancylobacter sp. Lp-2]|uniref:TetR/AcrR family transcriptional regulator n=1 Tax=Ancylobacter sp. Lp-2 TaxID=2881339 RepID=UPI001E4F7872|nr:TetR/AcrR family transcriptional regulator [Ancylobacter sp. Lp-2]MCB4770767.1 TetR/AcrR family transcriptional regulator [Ancylobacter sp. Lp-2]
MKDVPIPEESPRKSAPAATVASPGPPDAPSRVSAGPRRSKAASEAILDAAEALLAERGYAGFSIEGVAKRAGAGKPTIYRWWSSKAALLLDVYARQKLELAEDATGTLEGDLSAMIRTISRFWRETPAGGAFRSIIAEAQSDPAALVALRDFLAERRHHVAVVFDRAHLRGELDPAVDLDTTVDIVGGYVWARLLTDRVEDDVEAITVAVHQIVHGMRRR